MNKSNLKFLGLFLVLTIGVVSCKKIKPSEVSDAVTSGTWRITLFSEDGQNETNYFSGYQFTFNTDGTVTADNGSTQVSGTWSTNDSDDDSSGGADFNLNFPATNNFDELTDDWHVIEQSVTILKLEDVSGGNGGVDKLTFEKN